MKIWSMLAVFCLQGCLLDLYGGDPRVQMRNRCGTYRVEELRAGDPDQPAWSRVFDVPVDSGKVSEVVDLPMAGDLRMSVRLVSVSGGDTVVPFALSTDVGGFVQVDVWEDAQRHPVLRY